MYEIPVWQKVLTAIAVFAALSFAVIAFTWTPTKPAAPVAAVPPKEDCKQDHDKDHGKAEKRDRKSHLRDGDERAKREMGKIRDDLRDHDKRR